MKKGILLFVLLVQMEVFGQHFLPIQHDTIKANHQEFSLTGIADISGTSIGTDIASKFLFGGDITTEMKDKSLARHGKINRFGADLNAEFEYRNYKVNLFNKENLGFIIKGGIYSYNQLLYSKDLFQFAMYGNQSFVGTTANFSGSNFKSLTYHKIGFGIVDKTSKSSITLNFIGLNGSTSANLNTVEIYQNTDLDTVQLTYNGNLAMNSNSSFVKGLGFGIDFDYRIKGDNFKGNPVYFQIVGRNLGMVFSTSKNDYYSSNSKVQFTGFSYNDIANGGSIIGDNLAILDSLGVKKEAKNQMQLLPGLLQISKLIDLNSNKKIQEFYGARMYLSKVSIPQVFAGLNYKPISFLNIGASVSYGGFSRFKGGAYLSYNQKKLNIGIASENLFSKTGVSYLIRLQCAF